jgi:aminopeptidase YwaD
VVVLLLLAELLADYRGELVVEIIALNGEDYYSNPGEQVYLASSAAAFENIILGVNLDGVGYHRGRTAYSLYHCPEEIADLVGRTFARHTGIIEGEPWYQGDHALFLMNEVPAVAITSEEVEHILSDIVHTPKDSPDTVDVGKLVRTALVLRDLVLHLDGAI